MTPLPVAFPDTDARVIGAAYVPLQATAPVPESSATIDVPDPAKTFVGVATSHGSRLPRERTQRNAPFVAFSARSRPSSAPKTTAPPARARFPVGRAGRVCDQIVLPKAGWSARTAVPAATNAAVGVARAAPFAVVPRFAVHTRSPVDPGGSGIPWSPFALPFTSSPWRRPPSSSARMKSPTSASPVWRNVTGSGIGFANAESQTTAPADAERARTWPSPEPKTTMSRTRRGADRIAGVPALEYTAPVKFQDSAPVVRIRTERTSRHSGRTPFCSVRRMYT